MEEERNWADDKSLYTQSCNQCLLQFVASKHRSICKKCDTENKIWDQVVRTFEILGAPIDVVATYGSKGDTLTDAEILEIMTSWNDMHSHTTGDN